MPPDALIATVRSEIGPAAAAMELRGGNRLFVDIDRARLREIALRLKSRGARYLVAVGSDDRARSGAFGLIHLFAFDKERLAVILRTSAPADRPEFDSLTPDFPAAGWSEREYIDLLGFGFPGHPKPKKLILADDWPAGIHPLRKEVPHNLVPPSAEDVAYRLDEAPPGTTVVPIGPFHTSLHEPAHFAVYVDGETIKGCDYRGFMTHRGIEKLCQTQVSYNEIPFVAERICGICGSVHATAYAQAVEEAAGIRIGRRAEFIRVLMLEIERLHSHLLWLGVAGHLIGYDTIFMQSWRVREPIMWLSERLTGNRKTYGMVVIGGVRRDVTPALAEDIRGVMKTLETEVTTIRNAIIKDTAIHKRTKGVGVLTREEAAAWSLVGPVARARGIDIDARRDFPYAAYDALDFEVPVTDSGDVWGTLVVRLAEIFESIGIIRQVLDRMPPDGPLLAEVEERLPAFRHGLSMVEAPRGESVHYVVTGEENRPERWRVRAPTYINLQGVPGMLLDNQLADFPIIVGSIDPCFSCTDRVIVLDRRSGRGSVYGKPDLEGLSRGRRR
jgi:Ni,Fe-hydrogenase III large subunit/Ni,Fe-hydrogenase III component G